MFLPHDDCFLNILIFCFNIKNLHSRANELLFFTFLKSSNPNIGRPGKHFAPRTTLNKLSRRSAVSHGNIERETGQISKKDNKETLEYSEVNEQLIKSKLERELATKLPLHLASDTEVGRQMSLQQALAYKNALKQRIEDIDKIQSALGVSSKQNIQYETIGTIMQRAQDSQGLDELSPINIRPEVSQSLMNEQFDNAVSDTKTGNENRPISEGLMIPTAMRQLYDVFPTNDVPQPQSHSTQTMHLNEAMGSIATPEQALGNLVAPPITATTKIVIQDSNGLVRPYNVGH